MANYVNSNLIKDEIVLHRGTLSLWSLSGQILVGVLLLPLAGIGLYFLIAALIKYKTTELAVTNKRVITKIGLISRHSGPPVQLRFAADQWHGHGAHADQWHPVAPGIPSAVHGSAGPGRAALRDREPTPRRRRRGVVGHRRRRIQCLAGAGARCLAG